MKRIILFLSAIFSCFILSAQTYQPLTAPQQQQLFTQLDAPVASLQCQFEQEKNSSMLVDVVRSKGTLSFLAPNQMRWEYTSPQTTFFIYSKGSVISRNAQGEILRQSNRMVQEMSKLILSLLSGDALRSEKQFKVQSFDNGSQYKLLLTPINSRLKSMFSQIEIYLNRSTYLANTIILHEAGNDSTIIRFSNHKLNQKLPQSLFEINQ